MIRYSRTIEEHKILSYYDINILLHHMVFRVQSLSVRPRIERDSMIIMR